MRPSSTQRLIDDWLTPTTSVRSGSRPLPTLDVVVGYGLDLDERYRNLDRNWHLLADVDPIINHEALMIYGEQDMVARGANLEHFVPNVDVVTVDCGHWIQEELPDQTNRTMLEWLNRDRVG